MADYYVSSTEDELTSTGNAGTLGDPMGLQEGIDAMSGGDNLYILDDGVYEPAGTVNLLTTGASGSSRFNVIGVNSSGTEDGSTPEIRPSTGSTYCFTGGNGKWYHFKNLILNDNGRGGITALDNSIVENCHSSDAGTRHLVEACNDITLLNCTKTDGTGYLSNFIADGGSLIGCYATNCQGLVQTINASRRGIIIHGCVVKDVTSTGILILANSDTGISISNTIAIGCGAGGILVSSEANPDTSIRNTIVYNCTGNGISTIQSAETGNQRILLDGVVCMDNSGYGYEWNTEAYVTIISAYSYNNTSGDDTGEASILGSIEALTGDPFEGAASDNFLINDTAGAGATLRAISETLPGISFDGFYPYRSLIGTLSSGGGTTTYWG